MKLNEDFLRKMSEATQLLQTSGPAAATAAIQCVLKGTGVDTVDAHAFSDQFIDINPVPGKADEEPSGSLSTGLLDRLRNLSGGAWANPLAKQPIHDVDLDAGLQRDAPGKFVSGSCTNRAGSRTYKLYIPISYNGEPLPLIVMLHGCKQNPDDFAAGTGMNRIAEENNCLVLYPSQALNANGSNCWNWFNASDQKRDAGEPSIIADMTRQVMRDYRVDSDRVYVAGLSAGGAMATILAAAYPDLYAAVGIHSGLPAGSAHDVASAFSAMKDGGKAARARPYRQVVPAIVFHGDRDHTVHPSNGVGALAQCMNPSMDAGGNGSTPHKTSAVKGQIPQGRAYTRKVYSDGEGAAIAEHWIIHGAGHAWSGGSKAGSYTDPKGPDASQEMVRFFQAHPKRSSAAR
jgi:poly(hydroxyalkanoate) depolymerase family esterase